MKSKLSAALAAAWCYGINGKALSTIAASILLLGGHCSPVNAGFF